MIIFPAIDLKDGKCVRLSRGNFKKIKCYNSSPLDQALFFQDLGFKNLHMVDLDGSISGKLENKNEIKNILKKTNLNLQLGGGFRKINKVKEWIEFGVDKIVISSVFFDNKSEFIKICQKYHSKIAFALDLKKNFIAYQGWLKKKKIDLKKFIKILNYCKISRIIFTDINRDGLQSGANIETAKTIVKISKKPVILSGGISSLAEVIKLKKMSLFQGIIIGKAIYEGKINLKKLSKLQNE